MAIDHDAIGKVMWTKGFNDSGCTGVLPNPFVHMSKEWMRRKEFATERSMIDQKIEALYEPRFITHPETSELIGSLVTMMDAKKVLEVGMYSGFTTLHMIKAVYGKPGAQVTSIDCNPAHDREFFEKPEITKHFRFIHGWTPAAIEALKGENFDLVFIDSDHSVEHSNKERAALEKVTGPGCMWVFHDVPRHPTPGNTEEPPIRRWLQDLVNDGYLKGLCVPSPEQPDCLETFGAGYDQLCNPGLGIFIRQ